MLPFTREQFFTVFSEYNDAVWPAQVGLYIVGLMATFLAFRRSRAASRAVFGALALLWAWMGIAYHAGFFASINPAAKLFAAAFLLQAGIFGYLALRKEGTAVIPRRDLKGYVGGALIAVGIVIYPLLSFLAGHRFPAQPTFGLPCPTAIFTFGVLLWSERVPWYVAVIPALWGVTGTFAAVRLGVPEDFLLGFSLLACAAVIAAARRQPILHPAA